MTGHDEFFIGWTGRAPAGLARFVGLRAAAAVVTALGAVLALAAWQRPYARAHFEYGALRTFEGVLEHVPHPTLVVARPGSDGAVSRWLVTRFGKFGAEQLTAPLEGRRVRVAGELIHRDGTTMIEIDGASLEDLGPAGRVTPAPTRRPVTLRGEVVDSKCFLGVMKPGDLKPHRACAVRCISGGVPPAFVVRDEEGRATYHLLVGERGEALNALVLELDLVAEPVEVTGTLEELDSLRVLRVAPTGFRRLDPPEVRVTPGSGR